MAVPKTKISKSRRNMRRSHDFLTATKSIECSECGENKLPHHMCAACGTYKGRKILDLDVDQQA